MAKMEEERSRHQFFVLCFISRFAYWSVGQLSFLTADSTLFNMFGTALANNLVAKGTKLGANLDNILHWRHYFPQDRVLQEPSFALSSKECPIVQVHESAPLRREWFKRASAYPPDDSQRSYHYVTTEEECDAACIQLCSASRAPGLLGLDGEFVSHKDPFSIWPTERRVFRPYAPQAKGPFLRTLTFANADGYIAIFDLFALNQPHDLRGGIDCFDPLESQSLPPSSLLRLLLDPSVCRMGFDLTQDLHAVFNTFGILVPEFSYLDVQAAWRDSPSAPIGLRPEMSFTPSLKHVYEYLFDEKIPKDNQGRQFSWFGMAPLWQLQPSVLQYAAMDAWYALQIGVALILETKWLADPEHLYGHHTLPFPGLRQCVFDQFVAT